MSESLRQDLASFLGLDVDSEPLPRLTEIYQNTTVQTFDICQPQYKNLRRELVRIGKAASAWILEFFVDQPTVTVSSREHFERLLKTWAHDPCQEKATKLKGQEAKEEVTEPAVGIEP